MLFQGGKGYSVGCEKYFYCCYPCCWCSGIVKDLRHTCLGRREGGGSVGLEGGTLLSAKARAHTDINRTASHMQTIVVALLELFRVFHRERPEGEGVLHVRICHGRFPVHAAERNVSGSRSRRRTEGVVGNIEKGGFYTLRRFYKGTSRTEFVNLSPKQGEAGEQYRTWLPKVPVENAREPQSAVFTFVGVTRIEHGIYLPVPWKKSHIYCRTP